MKIIQGPLLRLLFCLTFASGAANLYADPLGWSKLEPLPDEHGFAGSFAGISEDALIVAGGANFPDAYPWDGGEKVYHDRIFVLEEPDGSWRIAEERLPKPIGYGVSVTIPSKNVVVCVGGNNSDGTYSDAYQLKWTSGKIQIEPLPALPVNSTQGSGVAIGEAIYFASGEENGQTHQKIFKLDLAEESPAWKELPWPEGAPGRVLSVAGAIGKQLYLFGGADLGSDKWDKRTFLTDAWKLDTVTEEWRRIADLPRHAAAGPTPAIQSGASHLLLIGGASREFVDAQRALRPETDGNGLEHPGFPKGILAYHTITDTWIDRGSWPSNSPAPVTATTVLWGENYVIPTGEIKPGIRSPQVLVAEPLPVRRSFGVFNWIVVIAYLGGMVVIGFLFSKRGKSTDDYFRGGQRVPWIVAGLSIFATMLSAITFMSVPASAYATNISLYLGSITVLIAIPIVVYFYLPRFRKLNVTSAYEYLEHRFNLASRLFASVSFILFHIGRIAIVLYLPALALSQVSSVNVVTCIIIIGILCVIYTVMGGIEAVVWTDAVQAVVLMGGALLCMILVFSGVDGGFSTVWQTAVEDEKLFQNVTGSFDIKDGTTTFYVIIVAFFFNNLIPYTSGQDVVQRYVTTATEKEAARSLWATMWLAVFGSLTFFGLGVALYAFYKANPASLETGMRTDAILPFFILAELPAGVAGLLIAAIFAASQSTVSSSLNSIATTYVTDFHSRVFFPKSSDKSRLNVARAVVVLIGIAGITVACIMAKSEMDSAFESFNKLIGLSVGSLGGLFALGVFNRKASGNGAIVGAVVAFATVLALSLTGAPVSGLLFGLVGFTTCFVVGSLVSIASPRKNFSEV